MNTRFLIARKSGRHFLWIRYRSRGQALVNFHFDNQILSFGTKFSSTGKACRWLRLGEESLRMVEKGFHLLRIEVMEGKLDIDAFLFTDNLSLTPRGKSRYLNQENPEELNSLIREVKEKISNHRLVKAGAVQYAACAAIGPQRRGGMPREEYRLTKIGAIMDEASRMGVDIICLPEWITSPGSRRHSKAIPKDEEWRRPETIPGGWSVEYVRQKARENRIYVVGWAWERDGRDDYNTAYIVNRQGQITGRYRKVHCSGGKDGGAFPVFQTEFGKVGILICYDMQFPEAARILTLKGAEIIFYPLAGDERGNPEWEAMLRGRAIDNNVYIVASPFSEVAGLIVDLDGAVIARTDIRGMELCRAADYDGYIIRHKDALKGNGIAVAEIDLDRVKGHGAINNRRAMIIRHRRPEIYQELTDAAFANKGNQLPVRLDMDMYSR